MKTCNILLDDMANGTNTYDFKDIIIGNWDKKSFDLDKNIKFHILLKQPATDGDEEKTVDVTDCYIINAKNLAKTTQENGSLIFEHVRVTYSRKTELKFKKESTC